MKARVWIVGGWKECEEMEEKWVENQKGKGRNQTREEKDREGEWGKKGRVSGWQGERRRLKIVV